SVTDEEIKLDMPPFYTESVKEFDELDHEELGEEFSFVSVPSSQESAAILAEAQLKKSTVISQAEWEASLPQLKRESPVERIQQKQQDRENLMKAVSDLLAEADDLLSERDEKPEESVAEVEPAAEPEAVSADAVDE